MPYFNVLDGLSIHEVLEKGLVELYNQKITNQTLALRWLGEYILKTNPNIPTIVKPKEQQVS